MSNNTDLHWTVELSVSVTIIDKQHKELFSYLTQIRDSIERQDFFLTRLVLEEFIAYTNMHFAEEEALMRNFSYPGYVDHELRHQSLLEEIHQLKRNIEAERTPVSLALLDFLRVWLTEHIKTSDKRLGNFLKVCDSGL